MKNFYLMVVLAILLPLSIIAKPVDKSLLGPAQPNQFFDIGSVGIDPADVTNVKVGDMPFTQMAFKPIETNLEFYWTAMRDGVTPFTYEPKSNTLIYVTTKREAVGQWAYGFVYLHFSNDGGQNWTSTQVWTSTQLDTKKEMMCFSPSVAVLNPNNESDPSKFKYQITFTPFKPRPTPNDTLYWAEGNFYLYFDGTGWDGVNTFEEKGPIANNIGQAQEWGSSDKQTLAVSSPKGDYFYVYGTLNPKEGYQYGAYGFAYTDMTGSKLDPLSKIPTTWALSQFKDPGSLLSSWNAPIRLGADKEGNIYAFVFNIFSADFPEKRVPAFCKSTDNGSTWSQFIKMPNSFIADFLQLYGHDTKFDDYTIAYPYTNFGSVVTGVDEFSMFIRLFSNIGPSVDDRVSTGHYVEVQYKNGQWQTLRKIGDNITVPVKIANVAERNQPLKDSLMAVQYTRNNELQAALTADGNAIIVKWVDAPNSNYFFKLKNPVTLIGSSPVETIDSLLSMDIFVAYRNLNEQNWQQPYNLTQDLWYNKGTYIPETVPSLSQIPVVEYVTQASVAPSLRTAYPRFVQNMVSDQGANYTLITAVHDAKNPVPVRNPVIQDESGLITSILEQLPFSLKDISPNPADNFTVVKFKLDFDANVSVKIHNTMGQVVKEVYSGQAQAGQNTINVVTSDLPAGAYYYSINVNGKSQTKLLNVIR